MGYTTKIMTAVEQPDTGLTYEQSGVNIQAGDELVEHIRSIVARTHSPRVLGPHGAFAGMFRLDFNEKIFKRNYKEPVLVSCTDGVGTKLKIATTLGIVDTVGLDCVAMNVNDLIVQGAEPLFFLDYIGLHSQDPRETAKIIEGVARGCELADCALIGGECAEMPDIYGPGEFDLVGFSVGVVELERAIDPNRVQPGDVLIGLASSGIHSNGYTLVRAIVDSAGLDLQAVHEDGQNRAGETRTLGEVLLEPTRIYARSITHLLRHYKVKKIISMMAHITGGGLPGNLPRVLLDDIDAVIKRDSWTVPPIFDFLARHGNVEPDEMDRVFNMGIGYVLAVRPAFVDSIIKQLTKDGEEATVIGSIEQGQGRLRWA
jgi:phosphoribosylformylglycinamidine cyclo-ligase